MAWYNAGDWSAVRVDRRGLILQQMCYAINERETAVGRTLTAWPNGVAASPSSSAFDGYRVDRAGLVLTAIRDAIPSLYDTAQAERFVQSDGSNWTSALLFTAAGYGASWLAIDGEITNDVRPFLQTKAVIDELIYYTEASSDYIGTHTFDNLFKASTTAYASAQAAYDYTIANLAVDTFISRQISYVPGYNTGTTLYRYQVASKITSFVTFGGNQPASFVLKIADLVNNASVAGSPDSVPMSINGVAGFDLTRSTDGIGFMSVHIGVDVPLNPYYNMPGYGVGTDVVLETTPPATHPGKIDIATGTASLRSSYIDGTDPINTYYIQTLTPTYG